MQTPFLIKILSYEKKDNAGDISGAGGGSFQNFVVFCCFIRHLYRGMFCTRSGGSSIHNSLYPFPHLEG